MENKIIYLFIASCFFFALVACGGGGDTATEAAPVEEYELDKNEKKEVSPIIVAEGWDRPREKKLFMEGCFSGFGDSFTPERKQMIEKYCSCCLEKMMDQYSSYKEMNKAASRWTVEEFGNAAGDCVDILR